MRKCKIRKMEIEDGSISEKKWEDNDIEKKGKQNAELRVHDKQIIHIA